VRIQALLKREWQVVKLGEPVYRIVSKVLIITIIGSLVGYFGVEALRYFGY
jgi:hypothetical protein